ncbi:MAG: methionine synthase [Defluviitaleaceae bacterium]|nr:methionine synthase [Defluviitaleaceae bacterium]
MDNTKSEILRYLGHKNQQVPDELHTMIDECLAQMQGVIVPRQIHREFDITADSGGISLAGTEIVLRGRDIAKHLHECDKAVVIAATLGAEADRLIVKWKHADLTRCLILDACATQLIEQYCDRIELEIREKAVASGFMATRRFSPGYGDFPLEIQPQILNLLHAETRIGLTCTDSLILLPRKSVTAIIGLGKNLSVAVGGCISCDMRAACNYRKGIGADECTRIDER